jgi:hypothetical protein
MNIHIVGKEVVPGIPFTLRRTTPPHLLIRKLG